MHRVQFFCIVHRCRICPPLLIGTLSHTRVSMLRLINSTAAVIKFAKIPEITSSGGALTVFFTNPQKKMSHGIKSGDRSDHRVNASSSCPVRPIHFCRKISLRYLATVNLSRRIPLGTLVSGYWMWFLSFVSQRPLDLVTLYGQGGQHYWKGRSVEFARSSACPTTWNWSKAVIIVT
jgi:hypothetical protein